MRNKWDTNIGIWQFSCLTSRLLVKWLVLNLPLAGTINLDLMSRVDYCWNHQKDIIASNACWMVPSGKRWLIVFVYNSCLEGVYHTLSYLTTWYIQWLIWNQWLVMVVETYETTIDDQTLRANQSTSNDGWLIMRGWYDWSSELQNGTPFGFGRRLLRLSTLYD